MQVLKNNKGTPFGLCGGRAAKYNKQNMSRPPHKGPKEVPLVILGGVTHTVQIDCHTLLLQFQNNMNTKDP